MLESLSPPETLVVLMPLYNEEVGISKVLNDWTSELRKLGKKCVAWFYLGEKSMSCVNVAELFRSKLPKPGTLGSYGGA